MSTLKSSAEDLTLNADGSGNDMIFQSNGSNVATLDQAGTLTATTFTGAATDATKLPLAGGTLTGNTTIAVNASPTLKLKRTGNNAGNGNIECLGADDSVDYKIAFAQSAGIMSFDVGGTRMLGVTSSGLCFNSDSAAANALDDYEEGTHTVTISMGSGTATLSVNEFAYTKIGRQVHVCGQIRVGTVSSPDGELQLSLPFTVKSGDTGLSAGNYRTYNIDTPNDGESNVIYSDPNTAHAVLQWSRDNSSGTNERATENGYFLIGLTYFTA